MERDDNGNIMLDGNDRPNIVPSVTLETRLHF
jgi:hypothetical protein